MGELIKSVLLFLFALCFCLFWAYFLDSFAVKWNFIHDQYCTRGRFLRDTFSCTLRFIFFGYNNPNLKRNGIFYVRITFALTY